MSPMRQLHHHFPSLDSTNVWAKQHLAQCPLEALTVIRAEYQTAGRGQQGRPWYAPPGTNLLMTFVFFIDTQAADPLRLTHLLGITLCTWLQKIGLDPLIKWPNDIMLDGKKLAGILCETQTYLGQEAIILGLGLNVNLQDTQAIDQPATSLYLETHHLWDLDNVYATLCQLFHEQLELYKKRGFTHFLDAGVKIVKWSGQE